MRFFFIADPSPEHMSNEQFRLFLYFYIFIVFQFTHKKDNPTAPMVMPPTPDLPPITDHNTDCHIVSTKVWEWN